MRGVISGSLCVIEFIGSTAIHQLQRREETETTQPSSLYQLSLRGCEL